MTSTSNAATTTTSTATNATNATDAPAFYHNLHVKYIQTLSSKIDSKSSYEGAVTEHLRMSGIYWSLTALSLLVPFEELDTLMNLTGNSSEHDKSKPNIVDWVYSCYDPSSGGFGGNQNQDGHILYTLSALQILALAGQGENTSTNTSTSKSTNGLLSDKRLLEIKPKLIQFISSLQQEDGSFAGDEWGEVDTRFTYCALSSLSLLGEIDKIQDKDKSGNSHTHVDVDVDKAAMYIVSCQNFDGGFGCTPGAESHAGQIFTCIGALSIARRLDLIQNVELLSWWLAERQCDSGGLNGRPEKQADVCYSWWILSCLCILGRVDYIKGTKLASFILKCQDDDDGGIADRPDDMVDVFHTFFGISGLSLIGTLHEGDGTTMRVIDGNECNEDGAARKYRMIDPVYALPTDVVQSLNLKGQIMTRKKKSENQDVDTNVDADADERLKQYERL